MWIKRDLSKIFESAASLEAIVLLGPRQVGKSSLLVHSFPTASFLSLDDLQLRTRARTDPAMFFLAAEASQIIIDEFQYAPELLSEIKLRIDSERRASLGRIAKHPPSYLMSGSNQIEIETAVRESLAGRASIFWLHGLSASEIFRHDTKTTLNSILFRGGFPELYIRKDLSVIHYINDYITTFIEKDIARSAGITKVEEFLVVTRLLASRVAELVNSDTIAKDSGVASKTVSEWRDILDRSRITFSLPVYSSNLNNRLIKTPKAFFIDSGLLVRLQGHLSQESILSTPQAGHLFENLVVAEALKTRDHFKMDWNLSYWRTKEGEEVDLIVESHNQRLLVEVKLGIQNVAPLSFSPGQRRALGTPIHGCIVTPGGTIERLSPETVRVPIWDFAEYLLSFFAGKKS